MKGFPSLKGKERYFAETHTDEFYSDNDVDEGCFDKQVVKAAIEKHMVCGFQPPDGWHNPTACRKCNLLRTLDLPREK